MKRGEINAVVKSTGESTYFAKTARLSADEGKKSHFQKAVLKIGDYLIVIAIVLVALILATALFRHDRMLTVLRFALVLTVAAIPVAMPTVLSITMAVGARLLSKKKAVVRRLAAVEEMAGIDILCSDKTGTLTKNELKLGDPRVRDDSGKEEMAVTAALASREEDEDAIDMAVLGALEDKSELEKYDVEHFDPFDAVKKRTEATVKDKDGHEFKVSKGAPQVILDLAANKDEIADDVNSAINEFAKKGYRSLGVARTDGDEKWRFLGIYPLFDPPRDDSRETIEAANNLGVQVKMVTGDQLAIAKEIARQLGMGTNIVSASTFPNVEHHLKGQLADSIEKADGFAEVFPEHKYHIVETLQDRQHIVGMTGDGVNDAPALKKADAGIAVSGATDAARSAADIVLLAPGLSVIVDAIAQSRKTFARMNSYAIYRIAETIRVLLFMTLSILVFNFYPVTAVMIVLLALLNDGAILSIAYDRAPGAKEPSAWNMRMVLGIASVLGVAGLAESFFLFYLAENYFHMSRDVIQSLIYLKLSVAGHLTVFVARTRGPFWSSRPSGILLVAVILTQALATVIAVYGFLMTPLGWTWAGLVWGYALLFFLVEDLVKRAAYKVFVAEESGFLARLSS